MLIVFYILLLPFKVSASASEGEGKRDDLECLSYPCTTYTRCRRRMITRGDAAYSFIATTLKYVSGEQRRDAGVLLVIHSLLKLLMQLLQVGVTGNICQYSRSFVFSIIRLVLPLNFSELLYVTINSKEENVVIVSDMRTPLCAFRVRDVIGVKKQRCGISPPCTSSACKAIIMAPTSWPV